MKKILAILLALVLVVGAFAACGGGKEDETTAAPNADEPAVASDYEYLKEKGKMIVGMTVYAPMNYKDKKTGEWTGFDTEFALAFGEKLGLEVEFFEIADWDSKFMELDTKNIDCVWNGMTITDEALNNSSVSKAYVKNAQVVVMKADKIKDFADAESMKDLAFVAEQGSAGKKAADAEGFNCTEVKYQSDVLVEVQSGAADAGVIDITMAKAMTGEGTSFEDLTYSLELQSEEYGVSFRKGSDMTEKFNAAMAEMKADGSLQALAEKYELNLAD